jgi:hypothetical protein
MLLYALTIFLSAFLLFQVQPVIAKIILPWFGGSSAVWSACMVFFQSVLLAGYLYAHWLHEKLSPKKQALVRTPAPCRTASTPFPIWLPCWPWSPTRC